MPRKILSKELAELEKKVELATHLVLSTTELSLSLMVLLYPHQLKLI